MLITLSGTITHKLEESVVIEVNGLGYQVWVPASQLEQLQLEHTVAVWIYEHIREDMRELYGFLEQTQRELFMKLLSVSGVGPKAALAIFSVDSFANLHQAIAAGDAAVLESAPGIGKRTAERIVMELRDSLGPVTSSGNMGAATVDGAVEALEALGYSRSTAAAALASVPADLDEKDRIKQALRSIGS